MSPTQAWLVRPDGLADRLRALRVQAGLQAKDLAEAVGWYASKVSRIETGQQMPSPDDIRTWARACGADADTTESLLKILEEARAERTAWKRRMRRGQEAVQLDYNRLTAESTVIRYFETAWVPGFLQTVPYARAVFLEMVSLHDLDVKDIDAAVATRMQRQQLLYDPNKRFELLIAEPVLRWLLVPADVMRGQLDRLQTIIGAPNVRFGIIPMGVPLTTTPQHAFQMYDDLVIVEGFLGEQVHRGEDAAKYTQIMDRLWENAVTGDQARELLIAAARALPA
jgi:transcriptional regulator with XRE-family HTH domain